MVSEERREIRLLSLLLRTLALGILPAIFNGMIRPVQYRARKQTASLKRQPLASAPRTVPALLLRTLPLGILPATFGGMIRRCRRLPHCGSHGSGLISAADPRALSAVHRQHNAGDESRLVRREEERRVSDVPGRAHLAAQRDLR